MSEFEMENAAARGPFAEAMALGRVTAGPNGGVVKWYITHAPSRNLTFINHLEVEVNTALTSVNGTRQIRWILPLWQTVARS
ncbi:hypothetical protein GCM10007921_13500 [Tritonibacter mobilis]|nr:hypothetical protein GCM10007921_13500 [Tritonibacter mobilis]